MQVYFFSETTAQECGVLSVIGSTLVLLSSAMEKCAQAMWRFLVNVVSLLTGDSYDGSMTALVGELIATDADVTLGCGLWSTSLLFLQELSRSFLKSKCAAASRALEAR